MQRLSDRLRTWAEAQAGSTADSSEGSNGVGGWASTRRRTQTFVESPSSSPVIEIQVDRDGWRPRLAASKTGIFCVFEWGAGEGEHKIMNVIRNHPEHTHCLCSNDAAPWMTKSFDV